MLDKHTTSSSIPSTCERDQGVQHLVTSRRAVPFLRIGGVARIEVTGIPALECQVAMSSSTTSTRLHALRMLCRGASQRDTQKRSTRLRS